VRGKTSISSITLLRLYLEEAIKGRVRRLCDSCNGVDGNKRRWYRESNVDDAM
jgi:hypothetical protein